MEFKGIRGRLNKNQNERMMFSVKKQLNRLEPIGASKRDQDFTTKDVEKAYDDMIKTQKKFKDIRGEVTRTLEKSYHLIKLAAKRNLLETPGPKMLRSISTQRNYTALLKLENSRSISPILVKINSQTNIAEKSPSKSRSLDKNRLLRFFPTIGRSKSPGEFKLRQAEIDNIFDEKFMTKIFKESEETSNYVDTRLGKPRIFRYKGNNLPIKYEHELRTYIYGNFL